MRKKLPRMGIEGQYRGVKPQVFGRFAQAFQHRLVAAMNAIEIANGKRERHIGDGGKAPDNLHRFIRRRAKCAAHTRKERALKH